MAKVYTLISVHTEDCVNPQTDDVPLRLAEIASRFGCRLVPKVTTEKIRSLQRNGRQDVIEALKTQDVGFHMTNHSFPPTVPVYTQCMSWDEGVKEYERYERRGYEHWCHTFQRQASTYAPGTPSPFAFPVLRKWHISTYTCYDYVSMNGLPLHYMGILKTEWSGPNGLGIGFRVTEEGADKLLIKEFDRLYRRLYQQNGGLITIGSHELEWVTKDFWDVDNFRQGRLVLPEDLGPSETKSKAEIERGYDNFTALLRHIYQTPDSEIITSRELLNLYGDRIMGCTLSIDEIAELATQYIEEITFRPLRGQYVSAAEVFGLITSCLDIYFSTGSLPPSFPVKFYGGPSRSSQSTHRGPVTAALLRHTIVDVADYLNYWSRIPAEVRIGNDTLESGDYLSVISRALVELFRKGNVPHRIERIHTTVSCMEYAPVKATISTWPSFPPDFSDHNGVSLARLQCWSLKPAVTHSH